MSRKPWMIVSIVFAAWTALFLVAYVWLRALYGPSENADIAAVWTVVVGLIGSFAAGMCAMNGKP